MGPNVTRALLYHTITLQEQAAHLQRRRQREQENLEHTDKDIAGNDEDLTETLAALKEAHPDLVSDAGTVDWIATRERFGVGVRSPVDEKAEQ